VMTAAACRSLDDASRLKISRNRIGRLGCFG
jgi:hypothetical protein